METPSQPNSGASDHVMGLKVVRFSKPNFMTPPITMGEPWDQTGCALMTESNKDMRVNSEVPGLGISDLLEVHKIVPDKENLIYLGETYRVFVSLSNEGQEPVTDVVLKVEMLTPSARHLLHQSAPTSKVATGERMDQVLSHDVKDMGEHTLVCTVSYSLSTGEEKLLRRMLHFSVAKPLEVRPDFQIIEEDVLLTVSIQNVMHHPVYLEVVSFDPAAGFISNDYNITSSGVSIFGQDDVFRPRTTRQYLYRVSPQVNIHSSAGDISKNVSVGKLDIVWRGRFGERGRIQTGQLKAMVPPPPALQVKLSESPGRADLEKVFPIALTLTNNTENAMRLKCQLERSPGSGIVWCGIINQAISELPAKESIQLKLNVLPILPGLQVIGPMTLIDIMANYKKYSFSKLGQVYVQTNSTSSGPHPQLHTSLINTTA